MNRTILAAGLLTLLAGCSEPPPLSEAHFYPRGAAQLTPDPDAAPAFTDRVYVPVYSSIYWGSGETVTELSATLSIRNTDPQQPILLMSISYYDSQGALVRQYLEQPASLPAMATVDFVIERRDETGGAGANFLVEWGAAGEVYEPVMESVMLGQIGSVGISFTSQGRTLRKRGPAGSAAELK